MNELVLGRALERNRRLAGLTQAQVAARMRTTQPAVSRAEAGRVQPTFDFIKRFALATGRDIELDFRGRAEPGARRDRVRRVLGDYVFNPWDRSPTPAEAESLMADGLTRDAFEPSGAAHPR